MKKALRKIMKLAVTVCMLLTACTVTVFADAYPDVYAGGSGLASKGWSQGPSGNWSYLNGDTFLKYWAMIGPHWYFFDSNGSMCTGWQDIGGNRYYFSENSVDGHPKGSLYTSGVTPDGQRVDADGVSAGVPGGTSPGATGEASSGAYNPYGHTCVEVNLTTQTVYVYQGEQLVLTSPCVTGYKGVHDTTPGDWSIYYKEKDVYLTGPTWRSHVDFWMPFHGGMGLHDANWRGTSHENFGGQIYVTDGSHGCVNLPHDAAEQLYNIAFAGMPVHVHY